MSNPVRRATDGARKRASLWVDSLIQTRIREAVDRSSAELRKAQNASLYSLDYALSSGKAGGRDVSAGRLRSLAAEVRAISGQDNVDQYTRQTYQSLLELEWRGIGRIAGSTYNIMGKLMTTPLLNAPPGPILEIGTLFGIFAGGLVRQFERLGQTRDITVVDPLVGRQLQPGAEGPDSSGSPVVPQVVRDNLRLSGLTEDRYRLIQGYSTDPDVQAAAGDRKYAVVIVDGDHSEEGVYKDLLWVERICAGGAIVVLDDFGDRKWVGVQRAYERRREEGAPFKSLGTVSTSGYLRFAAS